MDLGSGGALVVSNVLLLRIGSILSSAKTRTRHCSGAARGLLSEGLNDSHESLSVVEPFMLCRDDYHSAVGSNGAQLRRHGQSSGLTNRQGGGCVKPRGRGK